uniref:Uncharacterized protein n=1 Tax=Opuntia streptacantha TaxID=393608 RepID=A0A7C9EMM7_OPUST
MVVIEQASDEEEEIRSNSKPESMSKASAVDESTDGEPETASVSKEVSEGFETASEGDHFDRGSDTGGEEEEEDDQHREVQQDHSAEQGKEEQTVPPPPKKDGSYHDALDDDQLKQKAIDQANDAKVEGNALFKEGLYEDALTKYEFALQVAPEIPSSMELRSICHANRAICFLKLGKYSETVKECTKALELNPSYVKALVRRGEALEKLERYDEAIADMKKILELDPSNDQARRNIVRLEPLAREKMEKMKEEMMGKLKDMGNSLLGRFGMSVDNFKAVKDPDTGSYSIQFQR